MNNSTTEHDSSKQEQDGLLNAAMPASQPVNKARRKWPFVLASILVLLGGAATYIFAIYIPNLPANVFKSAVNNFTEKRAGYTTTARLDQGGVNDPDYNLTAKTAANGDFSVDASAQDFIVNPTVSVRSVGKQQFILFNQVLGKTQLAAKYSNSGKPGFAENLAIFADGSLVSSNLDKWFEVPSYISASDTNTNAAPLNLTTADIQSLTAKEIETVNNVRSRKYEVVVSRDTFFKLIGQIEGNIGVGSAKLKTLDTTGASDQLTVNVWVNLKSKTIEQVSYNGRPFKDATLEIKTVRSDNQIAQPEKTYSAIDTLGFGIVNSSLFSKDLQPGSSAGDKERIADLKAIMTAIEMYKVKTGQYPARSDLAVGQESFITRKMPGAMLELFIDPAGHTIGANGSQYAYVPQGANGNEDCSGATCTKFFLATTLDNGKEFKLTSQN